MALQVSVVKGDPKPGEPEFVTIATTRPETMLGDTAVAVHPDPAAALDKAEAELREKLDAAPAKEKAAIEAEIEAANGAAKDAFAAAVDAARHGEARSEDLFAADRN